MKIDPSPDTVISAVYFDLLIGGFQIFTARESKYKRPALHETLIQSRDKN